ncbi:Maf family nucleotide pyrophosphatase [Prolixibacteraceae bacterium Z1-6]|uniref:dTTP/UTP pyrophosphatase n=1 Tax=Draconibacterium aestuarii TaxID=2998507 RepID=A0A9X3J6Q6_9BACT|nr:Maf family nucleotide pyrophosphatase [Prolixibacteraceae bacterium Z1-6]
MKELFKMEWFPKYNFILASKSPRRQQLLKSLNIDFSVETKEVDEIYPENLKKEEVPVFLAELKSKPFLSELSDKDLLITADTVVCLGEDILGKPKDYEEAFKMIQNLSGKEHQVITGVCLSSEKKMHSFYSLTNVQFKKLTNQEINYYIQQFKPFDKAGAYGIQEWIGTIGITHIEGSFYNVMGLPIQKLYEEIQKF